MWNFVSGGKAQLALFRVVMRAVQLVVRFDEPVKVVLFAKGATRAELEVTGVLPPPGSRTTTTHPSQGPNCVDIILSCLRTCTKLG
jgi:hypothetical protein